MAFLKFNDAAGTQDQKDCQGDPDINSSCGYYNAETDNSEISPNPATLRQVKAGTPFDVCYEMVADENEIQRACLTIFLSKCGRCPKWNDFKAELEA